jgi:hypothetical protein
MKRTASTAFTCLGLMTSRLDQLARLAEFFSMPHAPHDLPALVQNLAVVSEGPAADALGALGFFRLPLVLRMRQLAYFVVTADTDRPSR